MKYFVDTSFWCALYNANDEHHQEALAIWKTLSSLPLRLYTSDYIFDETITLINHKISHSSAVAWGKTLLNSKALNILHIDDRIFSKSWGLFQEYIDKGFSFTDCTSFVLMQVNQIEMALAYDRHFSQAGFTVNQIAHRSD